MDNNIWNVYSADDRGAEAEPELLGVYVNTLIVQGSLVVVYVGDGDRVRSVASASVKLRRPRTDPAQRAPSGTTRRAS